MDKVVTITVSIFSSNNNKTNFKIETDNEDILPVCYVIEDTLKMYQTNYWQCFPIYRKRADILKCQLIIIFLISI